MVLNEMTAYANTGSPPDHVAHRGAVCQRAIRQTLEPPLHGREHHVRGHADRPPARESGSIVLSLQESGRASQRVFSQRVFLGWLNGKVGYLPLSDRADGPPSGIHAPSVDQVGSPRGPSVLGTEAIWKRWIWYTGTGLRIDGTAIPGGGHVEISWSTTLWPQFGAAIDMLDNALVACPDALWREAVWQDPSVPAKRAEFWYVAYHALFWLDLYVSGSTVGFAPPAPFTLEELDPAGVVPKRPYSRDELRTYLAYSRQKCHTAIDTLTDEQARQHVDFPWAKGRAVSYVELQLYNMRHVQEHAAQLSLFLGQHAIPDADLDWVPRAKGDPDSL
jgi:hypothetical protein